MSESARERLLSWAHAEGFTSEQRANLLIAALDIEAAAEAQALARVADLEAARNVAYAERNLAAQLAAHFTADEDYPVWWGIDPAEPDWPVLYIEGPTGQVSWHIPKAEVIAAYPEFTGHFAPPGPEWDGHSIETKDDRIRALLVPQATDKEPE